MFSSIFLSMLLFVFINSTAAAIENRIVNSPGFRPDVHKYLVKLHIFYSDSPKVFLCSGSIIDDQWIISAAHCFPDNVTKVIIYQRIGPNVRELGYAVKAGISTHPQFFHIPNFEYPNAEKDIALMKTMAPIKFDSFADKISLARISGFGQQGIVAGYGYSEFGSEKPLEGPVILNKCIGPKNTNLVCTQHAVNIRPGDSGGALTTKDGLVGIVSGYSLGGKQSDYVDISIHFDWIQEVMNKRLH